MRGQAVDESRLGAAAADLRRVAERGPTVEAANEERPSTPLAPYVAAFALLPLAYVARRA